MKTEIQLFWLQSNDYSNDYKILHVFSASVSVFNTWLDKLEVQLQGKKDEAVDAEEISEELDVSPTYQLY